jgi:hypothetical protein
MTTVPKPIGATWANRLALLETPQAPILGRMLFDGADPQSIFH